MDILSIEEHVTLFIRRGEGHLREFKSALEGPPENKTPRKARDIAVDIAETLVAFANADGGDLLVGVEDGGAITGVDGLSADEIGVLEAAHKTHVHKDTPLKSVRIMKVTLESRLILHFSLPKGSERVHLTASGRSLQRRDAESVPIAPHKIQFERREQISREYDRQFVDGASPEDLDAESIRAAADAVSKGMSVEKCLQYLELAEYSSFGLHMRRAALLLFAKKPQKWHPRLQIRVIKVAGTKLGSGENYNVSSDKTADGNILTLADAGWEILRPHLVTTKMVEGARFEEVLIYPENACREALINAVAHRDYSEEGRGIEVYIFTDRIEFKNPGRLMSNLAIEDLKKFDGAHQSRNSGVIRTLKEAGLVRELGEGIPRIFSAMRSSGLVPPELKTNNNSFSVTFRNKIAYSPDEIFMNGDFSDYGPGAAQ